MRSAQSATEGQMAHPCPYRQTILSLRRGSCYDVASDRHRGLNRTGAGVDGR